MFARYPVAKKPNKQRLCSRCNCRGLQRATPSGQRCTILAAVKVTLLNSSGTVTLRAGRSTTTPPPRVPVPAEPGSLRESMVTGPRYLYSVVPGGQVIPKENNAAVYLEPPIIPVAVPVNRRRSQHTFARLACRDLPPRPDLALVCAGVI